MDFINPTLWGWPQIVYLIFAFLLLVLEVINHGKPKVDSNKEPHKYNGFAALLARLFWAFILAMGGFFAGGVHNG